MSETVIKVENISKFYQLGLINHGTLAKDLQGWWAKIRGREDPNSQVSLLNSQNNNSNNDFIYALKDVSFDVRQGEVLGIIGANGAGKSTLLKILSRVTSPTSGCIKIKGRIGSLLEVGTGFHPELTGRENIYLNGAILGMRKHEIDRKLDEIIDFSGVEKFIDTPVKRYSSGMYVRLAFAVAAHLDPEILVVDEVLAVGDADFQKKCLGKMDDVSKKEGRTVLFVSHNMAAVRQLCTRGILLEKGTIKFSGDIEDVIDYYMHECVPPILDCLVSEMPREGKCTGQIRFSNILFLDENNNQIEPHCGKFLRIRVFIVAPEAVKKCFISIGVNDYYDTRILSFQSQMRDCVFHFDKGEHFIDCDIPKLPLTGGQYKIGLWATVDGLCADHIYYTIPLNVTNDDFFGTGREISANLKGRVVLCDHFWRLNK